MDVPGALGDAPSYYAWLRGHADYKGQITFSAFFPPRGEGDRPSYDGRYAPLLSRLGVQPYRHQVETLAALEAGLNVVAATPTASGKSLGYQAPVLHALSKGGAALLLFPTKALAHDQLDKLRALSSVLKLSGLTSSSITSYDGDTPISKRREVRECAPCILTNPDMLHYGILPHHASWARFLGRLSFIVVDELHAYRGVMGAHVANILRRLLRLARHHGATPQVIAASATIGNPAAHAAALTGLDFVPVTEDAGPRAARELLFWRPPDLPGPESAGDARRRSVNTEAADLARLFVRAGLKSIFFCNSRKVAELLRRYAREGLDDDEAARLQSYRAGYTPEDRRAIEAGFKGGDIQVLTATSALELGVDVGGVDAVVLVGYPGSMTALWQRAGRAGRGGTRSLTLLIPGNDPLDEYYLTHPELIAEGRAEKAVADPFNTELHPRHLACAAFEKPLEEDEELVGDADLSHLPRFVKHKNRWFYRGTYPHKNLSVRGTGGKQIVLKNGLGQSLGVSDPATALRELHPGAVYLHQGESYLVRNLDLEHGVAVLLPHIEDYYTQARSETDIEILDQEAPLYGVNVGRVRVTSQVTSYVRKRLFSEAVLDERILELPEVAYPTQALWFNVRSAASVLHPSLLPAAMHALEHTLIGLLPAFVLCERADVGGVSYPAYPLTGEPLIFIYDGYPGGVGYARAGAALWDEWLTAARDLLQSCACKDGCPRCVLSPKCGNGNQTLDKGAALMLAEALLERPARVKLEA